MASSTGIPSSGTFWTSLPRPLLIAIAVVFCALTTVYAAIWMYDARSLYSPVELGFNNSHSQEYNDKTHWIRVADVVPGSPAEKAGLRVGDRIIGIDGIPLTSMDPWQAVYARSRPGDPVDFTVLRLGESQPLTLHGIFRAPAPLKGSEGLAKSSAQQIINLFPVLFLLVGFGVLFSRTNDANAWLLALVFSAFAAAPSLDNSLAIPAMPRAFAFAFRALFYGLLPALFCFFFAVFPVRSRLDRRMPWLKWVGLAIGATTVWPALATGNPQLPHIFSRVVGTQWRFLLEAGLRYDFIALGLISLAQNAFLKEVPLDARRKSKVILFGTIVGVLPIVLLRLAVDFMEYEPNFWMNAAAAIILALYPLSFAYAVVKHRVMEIPALLRRSARYLLVQRSYFLLLFCGAMLAIFLFARFFAGYFSQHSQFGMALSAVFGVALVWVSGPIVRRGTDRIDRAFFRSSYDARVILHNLAEKTRTVTDRHELASLLQVQIEGALHPQSLACYLDNGNGNLEPAEVTAFRGLNGGPTVPTRPRPKFPFRFGDRFILREAPTIPLNLPLIADLTRLGTAWDVPPPVSLAVYGEVLQKLQDYVDGPNGQLVTAGFDDVGERPELIPECMVPIVGRNSGLMGLLVLGPRLSEEPYSSEDKRLLDSVADQAAITLENIRMAEQIAVRMDADRRVAREMDIAREVQSRLFPQVFPKLATLEYAGDCIQARQVGGDYYDFWDLGSRHLALVLADISGKGISGALLMANLQANLRSRSAVARQDLLNASRDGNWLPGLLKSVNQLFYENTPDDRYATLFLAVYDDASRELEYVNCGHNPPLLFRATGEVERLTATASVIGIAAEWECTTERVQLRSDDVLVIYTDGVTEANDAGANEFGEDRLQDVVKKHRDASPTELLAAIQQGVKNFSFGEQFDDLTLIVARER
jgi:phosphoserine phosphatase RsbU/P